MEKLKKATRVFTIKIGGNRAIGEVVPNSGFTDYDDSILKRCELAREPERQVYVEVFGIEHFDHDPADAEIEAEYVRLGLKRPTIDHAVHFGDQQRDLLVPVEGHPIIFYLKDPIPDAYGRRLVLGLWRDGVSRKLHWDYLSPGNRWNRDYLFAGVRYFLRFENPAYLDGVCFINCLCQPPSILPEFRN